jgi:hypothetical protein
MYRDALLKPEYLARYFDPSSDCYVDFPVLKDADRAYRLQTATGLLPIRYYVGCLEFREFLLSDSVNYQRDKATGFMRMILTAPTRPAIPRNEQARI